MTRENPPSEAEPLRRAPSPTPAVLLRHTRLGLLALVSGLLVGLAAWAFLEGLAWATRTRLNNETLVWFLPLAGLATGLAYHAYGGRSAEGTGLLLKEIHEPSAWVPRRLAPMVSVAAVVSHLFGASVGREGTALQMSGSLTDLVNRTFRVDREDRRVMLVAALGGGFGAVFGAPWAGLVFGIEVQWVRRIRLRGVIRWLQQELRGGFGTPTEPEDLDEEDERLLEPGDDLAEARGFADTGDAPNARLAAAVLPTLVASFVGAAVVGLLGFHESARPRFTAALDASLFTGALATGIAAGVTALLFVELTEAVRHRMAHLVAWPPLRPFLGGILAVALAEIAGRKYLGLSLMLTDQAFVGHATTFTIPAWKLLFTAICLGCGYIGGEVTPMFVMGSTLGGAVAHLIGLDPVIGATLGYAAVFAGAANAPIACTVMAVEVFGPGVALPAAVACFASFVASGRWGVYHRRPERTPTATV